MVNCMIGAARGGDKQWESSRQAHRRLTRIRASSQTARLTVVRSSSTSQRRISDRARCRQRALDQNPEFKEVHEDVCANDGRIVTRRGVKIFSKWDVNALKQRLISLTPAGWCNFWERNYGRERERESPKSLLKGKRSSPNNKHGAYDWCIHLCIWLLASTSCLD